jgi:hypothetical protein
MRVGEVENAGVPAAGLLSLAETAGPSRDNGGGLRPHRCLSDRVKASERAATVRDGGEALAYFRWGGVGERAD